MHSPFNAASRFLLDVAFASRADVGLCQATLLSNLVRNVSEAEAIKPPVAPLQYLDLYVTTVGTIRHVSKSKVGP